MKLRWRNPKQERNKNLLNDISIAPLRVTLCKICFRLDIFIRLKSLVFKFPLKAIATTRERRKVLIRRKLSHSLPSQRYKNFVFSEFSFKKIIF